MRDVVRLAVMGRPVAHSRSPEIHQMFAQASGVLLDYQKILVPEGMFRPLAEEFLLTGSGFNVTVPLKHEAFDFCAQTSLSARLARAVNTVYVKDGVIHGDNTDGVGLVRDLTVNLRWPLVQSRILVLGAGGAVSGILPELLKTNPASVHICNRTAAKAEALVTLAGDSRIRAVTIDQLETGYDVIINGTSAGLRDEPLGLAGSVVGERSGCYDMVYGNTQTNFQVWCREQQRGCRTSDGLGMLVEQAAASFEIWFGEKPETDSVLKVLRRLLVEGSVHPSGIKVS